MKEKLIVLDVETTGLQIPPRNGSCQQTHGQTTKPSSKEAVFDEILQLAIVNQDGEVLFYDSFAPLKIKAWPKAQAIHHISPEEVAEKQSFSARLEEIQGIIDRASLIVAYNAPFDLQFLEGQGVSLSKKPYACAMETFANGLIKRKRYGKTSAWRSLSTCANYFGLLNENPHNALADAQLTLACYKAMVNDARFCIRPQIWVGNETISMNEIIESTGLSH